RFLDHFRLKRLGQQNRNGRHRSSEQRPRRVWSPHLVSPPLSSFVNGILPVNTRSMHARERSAHASLLLVGARFWLEGVSMRSHHFCVVVPVPDLVRGLSRASTSFFAGCEGWQQARPRKRHPPPSRGQASSGRIVRRCSSQHEVVC